MLTSQLGIRMILLMGPTRVRPAPAAVLNALISVEVTNDEIDGDGFGLTFALAKDQLMDYSLLKSGALKQSTRVKIGVILGAMPQMLIDGIITHHELAPGSEPGEGTLTVKGKDLSMKLDLEEKNEPHPNQSDSMIVSKLLKKYSKYGLVSVVTPTTNVPISLQHTPNQHEPDLSCIQRLAKRNGFVFYIEPLGLTTNKAYWGPARRVGVKQHRLTHGMGPQSTLISPVFTYDALAGVKVGGRFVEPISKRAIPIPPLPSLRLPPLVQSAAQPIRKSLMRDTSNQKPGRAAVSALAAATNASDPVTGTGKIDTIRYGRVLRARRLVGIRGVGRTYDGTYYVRKVTHTITRGSYEQSFVVSREGTGALLPFVIP